MFDEILKYNKTWNIKTQRELIQENKKSWEADKKGFIANIIVIISILEV